MGVLSQRLVRRICVSCKEAYQATPEELSGYFSGYEGIPVTLYRGRGCARCFNTGYSGRVGIYEFVEVSETMRELITAKESVALLLEEAKRVGHRSLRYDGLKKALIGWTSAIQELLNLQFCRDLNGKDQIFELTQDGLDYLEKGLRDRFETGPDVYVLATVRKTVTGDEPSTSQRLRYVVRMPRALVEGEEIEWKYDFILEDKGFRNLVLSKVASLDTERVLEEMRGSSWNLEKLEFYEGDPKSLGRDYKQMGNGCLIWEQKPQ